MPYSLEEFRHDYLREHMKEVPVEERLKNLTPEEILAVAPEEELAKRMSPEKGFAHKAPVFGQAACFPRNAMLAVAV
jgi:hypothetical protein